MCCGGRNALTGAEADTEEADDSALGEADGDGPLRGDNVKRGAEGKAFLKARASASSPLVISEGVVPSAAPGFKDWGFSAGEALDAVDDADARDEDPARGAAARLDAADVSRPEGTAERSSVSGWTGCISARATCGSRASSVECATRVACCNSPTARLDCLRPLVICKEAAWREKVSLDAHATGEGEASATTGSSGVTPSSTGSGWSLPKTGA